MAGYVNQALGTVFVHRTNPAQKTIPKIIRDCIDGRLNAVLVQESEPWCPHDRTDFYVYGTMLNVGIELAAANTVGQTELVCLSKDRRTHEPVGAPYLAAQILKRCAAGDDVWIFQHRSR
jgi:hypothetical protein